MYEAPVSISALLDKKLKSLAEWAETLPQKQRQKDTITISPAEYLYLYNKAKKDAK